MTTTLSTTVRTLDGDLEIKRLVAEFKAARQALALWKEREAELREVLLKIFGVDHHGHWDARIGNRSVLKIDSTPIRRFDTSAFKVDHPDLYESYKTEITFTKIVTAGTAELPEPPA